MVRNITIFGDSWSKNSWKKGEHNEELTGSMTFESMFDEVNINTTNFSILSSSNILITETMYDNLDYIKESDLTIIFQTDPLRDVLIPDSVNIKLDKEKIPTKSSFDDLTVKLLTSFYNTLSSIQQLTNTHFLLVGGLSKLLTKEIPDNINYIKKSWTELVEPNFIDSYYEWSEPTLLVYSAINSNLSNFYYIEKEIHSKNYIWQSSNNFSFCHPADNAYIIMFDEIIKYIKENI